MADRYLLESSAVDGYLLEDGTGVLLLNTQFEQSAYRLYEDGTEAGSTAIAAQDTNITRDVNADSNLQLRTRIQNNTAIAGAATDDYQLQYSLNGGTYANVGGSEVIGFNSASLTDGAATTNRLTAGGLYSDNFNDNTFDTTKWTRSNATQIVEATQQLQLSTTLAAAYFTNKSVQIFNLTGSSAVVEIPDIGNTALASYEAYPIQVRRDASNDLEFVVASGSLLSIQVVAGVSTTLATIAFNATNHRWLRIRESGGTTFWDSSADGITWNNRNSVANPINVTAVSFEMTAGTYAAEATTTTLKLDNVAFGGSFVAGEISETGLVTDHQITASNYTEYLYSLTLVSSALANSDTLDFRLLRNSVAEIGNVLTPRITVSKASSIPNKVYIVNQSINRAGTY